MISNNLKMHIALLMLLDTVMEKQQDDPATNQIVDFKENTSGPIGIMTTSAGAPINHRDASISLNSNLLINEYFMDSITHLNRERLPERVVHAKGAGAFGYFETTLGISHICKAKMFSGIGTKTPVAVRFSIIAPDICGIDTTRDARGFAVKFYTEEGNFDIVGLNTPIFPIKDPLYFTAFAHANKRNPATNLRDNNMLWDFLTLRPESFYQFMMVFGDGGIPDGYRYMPGFGIHTFEVVNELGEKNFVRFHFSPDAGIKNLGSQEARYVAGIDSDYATRDLYNAIGNGEFPTWQVSIQILSLEDVKCAKFDVFDVTRALPVEQYPLLVIGRLVLNKNPVNYFADIEQLAFCPANVIPGILGSPDKMYEARRLAYRDAQYYRVGANYNKIEVNCPFRSKVLTYNRDGRAPVKNNGGDSPNYSPNSFHGPVPSPKNCSTPITIFQDEPNNFEQAREFYNRMSPGERSRLIENIVYSLGTVTDFLKIRAVKIYEIIDPDLGNRVAIGLASNNTN